MVDVFFMAYIELSRPRSIRFAIQLLTPASILSKLNGREAITLEDVSEVDDLFLDAKKSAKLLAETQNRFLM